MSQQLRVLALFAHPDDTEFLCAGTLIHLANRGAAIHIATMTSGDCGSTLFPASKISSIRVKEARRAAAMIGAQHTSLKEKDLLVFYDKRTLSKVMELLREINPTLVFTHSPSDYMVDHEAASRLCQTACFGGMCPNFHTGTRKPAKALRMIPHLYYAQPVGSADILGKEVLPGISVNIEETLERKAQMLACHESQQAWLKTQQNQTAPTDTMRKMAAQVGALAGFKSAEGFRQHLGQGFPQDDVPSTMLGELVRKPEN